VTKPTTHPAVGPTTTPRQLIARLAADEHLDLILSWREQASRWLASRGIDQWQRPWPDQDTMNARILAGIRSGTTWMIYPSWTDAAPVATVTLDYDADPQLWLPEEAAEPALYLRRLMTSGDARCRGLGPRILDWAAERARDAGDRWLRLDAYSTNTALHAKYIEWGFTHVRTVEDIDNPSGAVFQRPT
jgi:GNAT superfamily N-acetyltransferase